MEASRKKIVVGLLSALFPGIGHLYAGAMGRGLFFMLLFVGDIFGVVLVSMDGIVPLIVLLSILVPVIWVYALFDGLQTAERINRYGLRGEESMQGASTFGGGPLVRFALIAGALLAAAYWLSTGAARFVPVQGGRIVLIAAALLIAAGILVFAFGGRRK